jgi:hypothetical protein
MFATLFEGVTRLRFRREARRAHGFKSAVQWRVSGRTPKTTRRALLAELRAEPARRAAP